MINDGAGVGNVQGGARSLLNDAIGDGILLYFAAGGLGRVAGL